MNEFGSSYPAKLLLFGEYTVLSGSQALAVPLKRWKGKWLKQDRSNNASDMEAYAEWLENEKLLDPGQKERFLSDLRNGWKYESDIPQGYGIGSSGALVAAVYDRYMMPAKDLQRQQEDMAKMEGFFHGVSSGMDPLISYTRNAVYKDEKGIFHTVKDPGWPQGYNVYLLDSDQPRETGPLVNIYKAYLRDEEFKERIDKVLIPMVDHAIHLYLSGESILLEDCINMISQFERERFTDMIPPAIISQWDELVSKPGVYVKLCGAGGGGFFLVISTKRQPELTIKNLIALA